MIFATENAIEDILSGRKTQTRRLVRQPVIEHKRDGDWLQDGIVWSSHPCEMGKGLMGLNYTKAIRRYAIGQTYAVQPGRGKPSVGRIKLLKIREEDVRQISGDDAWSEGFDTRLHFWAAWVKMYAPDLTCIMDHWATAYDNNPFIGIIWTTYDYLANECKTPFMAWALDFEVAKEAV